MATPTVDIQGKATSIRLFSLNTPQMRVFHMSWFAFFLCFFAWCGVAPLMAIVREELGLTKAQIGNTIIASVMMTVIARLFVGWLCDRIGPRLSYTWLLMLCSLPVMGIGLANSYETFLLFRLGIGAIGGAFVITQYHTSVMFAPNVVGTANATSAGWGNLGGGVTQMVMPLVFAGFVGLGYSEHLSWRYCMVGAGVVCFLMGIAYFFFTTDLPHGNFKELRARGEYRPPEKVKGTFMQAARDRRVWALFVIYAACFGVELTMNNIAALYYMDFFGLSLKTAGLVAGLFGLMNIVARTTGGLVGDKFGQHWGLKGRVRWLFMVLIVEGIALTVFSRMTFLPVAIASMVVFSLFVQMAEGATFSVVPFINKHALGSVAGIVGAGGNAGAVAAGFLFRREDLSWSTSLLILGGVVLVVSFATLLVTFSPEEEREAQREHQLAAQEARELRLGGRAIPVLSPAGIFGAVTPVSLLRVFIGLALMIKGVYFILNMQEMEMMLGDIGRIDNVIAWYVVTVHVVGGFGLVFGIFTRGAAIANFPVLLGAVFFVHSGTGLFAGNTGSQFSILVLAVLAVFAWQGSGKFSLDHLRGTA